MIDKLLDGMGDFEYYFCKTPIVRSSKRQRQQSQVPVPDLEIPKCSAPLTTLQSFFKKKPPGRETFSPAFSARGQNTPTYQFETIRFILLLKMRAIPSTTIRAMLSELEDFVPELKSPEVEIPRITIRRLESSCRAQIIIWKSYNNGT
ncbi:Oidioi.mRNA.OKI2018_I69.PAR.g11815.t1.cds [Oikopleura dioica]|uniref:Oidioi.mRNA.OKI2018_I69.PAR.g11691.t1.cds n=1 Tax=Oikopleura dioica TaxID=34765 RepID=A0ABN7S1M9_OIKDI|nr:Oidioi.mRNA.OKI2018_I69.PAR.g11691.t1.cds [Oikopleura dioica]CAG5088357.1 Oidioi.mRNA.OKI2018_I69.PAR.g11815.t1.cds [Oikopleura dioica]